MFARKLPVLSLILVTVLCVACNDNDNNNVDTPTVPGNANVTNPLQDSSPIDKNIQSLLAENPVPGMAVAVISNLENPVIWSKGYGVMDVETSTPVTENSSF